MGRRMPPDALRGHAEALHTTFHEVIGSEVPNQQPAVLGWVYEVQARHLKPILDAALEQARGGDADEVLVVSAETAQPAQDVEERKKKDEGRPELGGGKAKKGRQSSEASTADALIDHDFEEPPPQLGLEDQHREDSNFVPAAGVAQPPPVQAPRKRQRQFINETNNEKK